MMTLRERIILKINEYRNSNFLETKAKIQRDLNHLMVNHLKDKTFSDKQQEKTNDLVEAYGIAVTFYLANEILYRKLHLSRRELDLKNSHFSIGFMESPPIAEEEFRGLDFDNAPILDAMGDRQLEEYLGLLKSGIKKYLLYTVAGYSRYSKNIPSSEANIRLLNQEVIRICDKCLQLCDAYQFPYGLKAAALSIKIEDGFHDDEVIREFFTMLNRVSHVSKNLLINTSKGELKEETLHALFYYPQIKYDSRLTVSLQKALFHKYYKNSRDMEKRIETNNKIIEDYSNIWINAIKPDLIYSIAKTLLEKEQSNDLYSKLMMAYNNEVIMRNECEILKLSYSYNTKKLQALIRQGMATGEKEALTIEDIIDSALKKSILKLMIDDSIRTQKIRGDFNRAEEGLQALHQSFNKEIFLNNGDIREWIRGELIDLKVEISHQWKQLRFLKDETTETFLIGKLMELLYNAFTYCSKQKDSYIKLAFAMDSVELLEEVVVADYFTITVENPIQKENPFTGGGKKGLSSLNEFMEVLNHNYEEDEATKKSLMLEKDPDLFRIKIFIKRNLFRSN